MERSARTLSGRHAAVDVHYPGGGGAVAAAVVAADLGFARIVAERVASLERVEPYRPGAFWERELPAIRAVVSGIGPIDLLVVDGYVQLDPAGRPGLGARVAAELAVPVIGVAKTAFRGAGHAIQVVRGQATRPLYVTAAGIPPHEAAALVQAMAGRYRLPDALRRVDALSRGVTRPPFPVRAPGQ
jgi:deoxyribonuclease V